MTPRNTEMTLHGGPALPGDLHARFLMTSRFLHSDPTNVGTAEGESPRRGLRSSSVT
jgi:hypothetical protein